MSDYKVPELNVFQFQPSVKDRDLTAPPGGEAKGDRYLIASVASGVWAGKEKYIATYNGATWDFTTPLEGMIVWVDDINVYYRYDGSLWNFIAKPLLQGTGNTISIFQLSNPPLSRIN